MNCDFIKGVWLAILFCPGYCLAGDGTDSTCFTAVSGGMEVRLYSVDGKPIIDATIEVKSKAGAIVRRTKILPKGNDLWKTFNMGGEYRFTVRAPMYKTVTTDLYQVEFSRCMGLARKVIDIRLERSSKVHYRADPLPFPVISFSAFEQKKVDHYERFIAGDAPGANPLFCNISGDNCFISAKYLFLKTKNNPEENMDVNKKRISALFKKSCSSGRGEACFILAGLLHNGYSEEHYSWVGYEFIIKACELGYLRACDY